MKKFLLLFLFSLGWGLSFTSASVVKNMDLNSLLTKLDHAIENDALRKQYENDIEELKKNLSASKLSLEEQYNIYSTITDKYHYFKCDSARLYALRALEIAEQIGNRGHIVDSKIKLAGILSRVAMFNETVSLLDGVDKEALSADQQYQYYRTLYETYVFWTNFYEDGFYNEDLAQKRDYYIEKLLSLSGVNDYDYEYALYYGMKHISIGEQDKAEKILLDFYPKLQFGTRSYSILTSIMSFLYDRQGKPTKMKKYLALSALSDIEGNIMENLSLQTLATKLYEEGDINRANAYIKKSMDDANFYNARIREVHLNKILPIINNAYQLDRSQRQKTLEQQLILISILSGSLLIGIFFIVLQIRKVSNAKRTISQINNSLHSKNKILSEINAELSETNQIKEEYIGHFLGLCSVYIEKMERYQQKLLAKARVSTMDELCKVIRSNEHLKDERKELYAIFDNSFLNLFPTFVDEFNDLLVEEERVSLKLNEKLNTELRIFALIRLGITDSNKIAEFLDYSLATIYNYRSRYKNKLAIPREKFEDAIMQIGSKNIIK